VILPGHELPARVDAGLEVVPAARAIVVVTHVVARIFNPPVSGRPDGLHYLPVAAGLKACTTS
jgi:hypothetical protein